MVEEKYGAKELVPIIDLTGERSEVSKLIVKACEGFGFFKVINHGVPFDVIEKMVDESCEFFAKPGPEKQRAGPPDPYGYGSKTIGCNGDTGEVEYILLHTNPLSISQCSNTISNDPTKFRYDIYTYINITLFFIYIFMLPYFFFFLNVYILIMALFFISSTSLRKATYVSKIEMTSKIIRIVLKA